MQGNIPLLTGTVFSVSEEGKAVCGELRTNLVETPGFEFHIYEGEAVPFFQNLIMEDSFFYPLTEFFYRKHLLFLCILIKIVGETAFFRKPLSFGRACILCAVCFDGQSFVIFFGSIAGTFHNNMVSLFDFSLLQCFGKFFCTARIFGIKKKPACDLVQAVHRKEALAHSMLRVHSDRLIHEGEVFTFRNNKILCSKIHENLPLKCTNLSLKL